MPAMHRHYTPTPSPHSLPLNRCVVENKAKAKLLHFCILLIKRGKIREKERNEYLKGE